MITFLKMPLLVKIAISLSSVNAFLPLAPSLIASGPPHEAAPTGTRLGAAGGLQSTPLTTCFMGVHNLGHYPLALVTPGPGIG